LHKKGFRIFAVILICIFVMLSFFACNDGEDSDNTEEHIVMPGQFTAMSDRSARNGEKRDWNAVSSFFINAGEFQQEMFNYDVGMVSPAAITDEDLGKLNEAGVWTVAIVNAGEDEQIRVADGMGPNGVASYYLFVGGNPIHNQLTGGFFVDAGNRVWRNIISARISSYLERGFDGILLQNLNTIVMHPETANGMAGMVMELSQNFPDAKFIANGGFGIFPDIHRYLDAVLFEGFYTFFDTRNNLNLDGTFDYDDAGYLANLVTAVSVINAIRQENYMPVFALEFFHNVTLGGALLDIYNHAYEYAFIPYIPLGGRTLNGDVTGHRLFPRVARGTRALMMPEIIEPIFTEALRSEWNLAYYGNGGRITVSSTFPGYVGGSILNNAIIGNAENEDRVHWSRISWASSENGDIPHWIEITVPEPRIVNEVEIYWAFEGEFLSSSNITIQLFVAGEWLDMIHVTNIPAGTEITSVVLENETHEVTRVRIWQEPGQGPISRPNLMWVTEVAMFE